MLGRILKKIKYYSIIIRLRASQIFGKALKKPKHLDEKSLIISLTSVGPRLHLIDLTLESLLSQSKQPDKIILWLSDEITLLPKKIEQYQARGIDVEMRRDVGPHTKLVYALAEYPNTAIVTADDDTLYPKRWFEELDEAYRKDNTAIHCHRAHMITLDNANKVKPYLQWKWLSQGESGPHDLIFPTGVGGVLYPQGSLHPDATNPELFIKLCPKADDIWFKVMSYLKGSRCLKIRPNFTEFFTVEQSQEIQNLGRANVRDGNNQQLDAVMQHYGIKFSN
jgi:hypothetical protein